MNTELNLYESLFMKNVVPLSIKDKPITNRLCRDILTNYGEIFYSHFHEKEIIVMKRVFNLIDSSINFPCDDKSFKNFKKKALRRNDDSVVQYFYDSSIKTIGTDSIRLPLLELAKFVEGDVDSLINWKGKHIVTFQLARELHKYFVKEGNMFTMRELIKLLAYIGGMQYNEEMYIKLYYRVYNFIKKVPILNSKGVKERLACKDILASDFFAIEKACDAIDVEKKQLTDTILKYEKELQSAKQNWDNLSDENERLRDKLLDEK